MNYEKFAIKLLEEEENKQEKFAFSEIQKSAIQCLLINPNPTDNTVHDYAEKKSISVDEMEQAIYSLATLFVEFMFKDGFSNEKKLDLNSVDKDELAMGIKIEHEHTKNWLVSMKIAMDHLSEHVKSDYYTRLLKMEKQMNEELKKA